MIYFFSPLFSFSNIYQISFSLFHLLLFILNHFCHHVFFWIWFLVTLCLADNHWLLFFPNSLLPIQDPLEIYRCCNLLFSLSSLEWFHNFFPWMSSSSPMCFIFHHLLVHNTSRNDQELLKLDFNHFIDCLK